jgi:acyl-CoA synthetase (AMP-forming)/AMP-acid ligase II
LKIPTRQQPETDRCHRRLPRNTMGKVQKAVLREQYRGLYAVNGPAIRF